MSGGKRLEWLRETWTSETQSDDFRHYKRALRIRELPLSLSLSLSLLAYDCSGHIFCRACLLVAALSTGDFVCRRSRIRFLDDNSSRLMLFNGPDACGVRFGAAL